MTQRPIPGFVPDVTFTCLPDHVTSHPEITPVRLAVVQALIASAEDDRRDARPGADGYSTTATRGRLLGLSRCGITSLRFALAWLVGIGAVEIVPDPAVVSGRRIVLLWRRIQSRSARDSARGGARQAPGGRAPGAQGARAVQPGGARMAPPPTSIEEKEEKGRETVPSNVAGPEAVAAPVEVAPETGRDGDDVVSEGEGEGEGEGQGEGRLQRRRRAVQLRLLLRSETGCVLVAEGGRIRREIPGGTPPPLSDRLPEVWSEIGPELEALKPELLEILAEEAARAPGPEPSPRAPLRRVEPDDAASPLPRLLTMIAAGADPAAIAAALAARYRDPKPETRDHFAAAAALLAPGELAGYVKDAERDEIKEKARYLASQLAEPMRAARRRAQNRPPGALTRSPAGGV